MIRPTKILAVILTLTVGGALSAEEAKGTIKSTDASKNHIVLKGTVRNDVYEVNKDAFMSLDGLKCKLQDFKEGDRVLISYEKRNDVMVASSVRGLRNSQETSGTVRAAYGEKREIVLKGVTRDTTYELAQDGLVWLNGKQSSLADIKGDDEVVVTYQQRGERNIATSVIAARK